MRLELDYLPCALPWCGSKTNIFTFYLNFQIFFQSDKSLIIGLEILTLHELAQQLAVEELKLVTNCLILGRARFFENRVPGRWNRWLRGSRGSLGGLEMWSSCRSQSATRWERPRWNLWKRCYLETDRVRPQRRSFLKIKWLIESDQNVERANFFLVFVKKAIKIWVQVVWKKRERKKKCQKWRKK